MGKFITPLIFLSRIFPCLALPNLTLNSSNQGLKNKSCLVVRKQVDFLDGY